MSGPIPELVAGVKNPATLSVCKDNVDAVYFSIDRFSFRAWARDITLVNLDTFVEQVQDRNLKKYLAVALFKKLVILSTQLSHDPTRFIPDLAYPDLAWRPKDFKMELVEGFERGSVCHIN